MSVNENPSTGRHRSDRRSQRPWPPLWRTRPGGRWQLPRERALPEIIRVSPLGATWIMGSDRALAVSCYDGAGPRFLGVINAKYGTPVRVNIFSGIVATIIVILAETVTSGNAAKYFGAVLGVTISTTLI